MSKNRYLADRDDAVYEKDVDAHIARLREILVMMAPETGAQALGAMRRHASHLPLAERVKALAGYRR